MDQDTSAIESYLQVGRAVVLQAQETRQTEKESRLKAFMRGWRAGQYIMMDCSAEGHLPRCFEADVPCVVRFMAEGLACGFETRLVDFGTAVYYGFIRVEWPGEVRHLPLRRHERIHVRVPCTITPPDSAPVSGTVCDLSVGGCRVEVEQLLPRDACCSLSFVLPDGTRIEDLKVTVKGLFRMKGGWAAGCEFDESQEELRGELDFYVAATLEHVRGERSDTPRILVIEADPHVGDRLRESLQQRGFAATITADAMDGLFLLRMSYPSALMINATLRSADAPEAASGELDGINLCRTVKSSERYGELPVLVYGANAEALKQAAQESGAVDCVELSSETDSLVERLMTHVKVEAPEPTEEAPEPAGEAPESAEEAPEPAGEAPEPVKEGT
jgi:CheY-like chemotaxis protein